MELRICEVDYKTGAMPNNSNGVVAVGLPHRSYSVSKQTPINQLEVKKADPSSAVLTLTHISFRAGGVSDGCTHSFIRN